MRRCYAAARVAPHLERTMILLVCGAVLAGLGLLAALLLVAVPIGLVTAAPGLTLWVLFPLFTLIGYGLLVIAARDPGAKAATRWLAPLLLLLALLAAIGLVVDGAGLMTLKGGAAPLWYVLVLGGLLGGIGSAASAARSA